MFHRSRTKIMLSIMGSLILLFLITLALILLASYREIRQNNTEMLERYADLYYLGQPTVEQRAQEPEPNRTEEIAEDWNGPGQGSKHGKADVVARVKTDVFDAILAGEKSFQGAFMKGDMPSVNGNFTMVRNFDTLFRFNEPEEQEEEV